MIIVRAPLRITLGGGGTDLPWFTKNHEGICLTAAIDKYVYITLHETFVNWLILHYSEHEKCTNISEIKHPIFQAALHRYHPEILKLEISSAADIPAGTGLGSSSTFTAALLQALAIHNRTPFSREDLAEEAAYVEMVVLNEPIGKQDHYASVFGGLRLTRFHDGGKVTCSNMMLLPYVIEDLEDNLCLFFTGEARSASKLLQKQKDQAEDLIDNLLMTKRLGIKTYTSLINGDTEEFGQLLNLQWQLKKDRQPLAIPGYIDDLYQKGLQAGALGGKLVGAGGGGFLMFYCRDKTRLRSVMRANYATEVRFRFDFNGVQTVLSS